MSSVQCLTFDANDTLLASGSADNTVRLWVVSDAREIQTLKGHAGSIYIVIFLPHPPLPASAAHDSTVRVWDATTGREVRKFEPEHDRHYAWQIVFSPAGSQFAWASLLGNEIEIWDLNLGVKLRTLKWYIGYDVAMAFSLDGLLFIVAEQPTRHKIWNLTTGQRLGEVYLKRPTYQIEFATDGDVSLTEHGLVPVYQRGPPGSFLGEPFSEVVIHMQRYPGLIYHGGWIYNRGQRILWLPVAYRGERSLINGT